MSCYHPLVGLPGEVNADTGKRKYDILPYSTWSPEIKEMHPGAISIPCGHCIGCRLDYSRSWADRMMLELDHFGGKAIFATLTYDNEHVPITIDPDTGEAGYFTLDKSDLQKFFKRLRKKYPDKEIRYYAAGEYGNTTFRPHYHAIIFGLCLEDFTDCVYHGRNDLGQVHFSSEDFYHIWQQGFVVLASVSWKTCAYVARYVQKKALAERNPFLDKFGCETEFSVMSRRPGIGAFYMQDHPGVFEYSNIYVSGYDRPISLPKYFIKKLELTDPELYANIKKQRSEFTEDRIFLKMQQTELSFIQQLELEENEKLLKANALRRNL